VNGGHAVDTSLSGANWADTKGDAPTRMSALARKAVRVVAANDLRGIVPLTETADGPAPVSPICHPDFGSAALNRIRHAASLHTDS
jgi:hypothetical protein